MKKAFKIIFIVIFISPFIINIIPIFSKSNNFNYIGYKECAKCHDADSIGSQVKAWKKSPHSKAYRLLLGGEAKEIAKTYKIKTPSEEYQCLKCHTTGAGKSNIEKEGVGCETCHGPGSAYNEFSNHASFNNRPAAYRKAIKNGMFPIIGIEGIKVREKICLHCHTLERPCAPKNSKEKEKKKLSLSIIADFVFKHPIRR